jgi:hypothetical protein
MKAKPYVPHEKKPWVDKHNKGMNEIHDLNLNQWIHYHLPGDTAPRTTKENRTWWVKRGWDD